MYCTVIESTNIACFFLYKQYAQCENNPITMIIEYMRSKKARTKMETMKQT